MYWMPQMRDPSRALPGARTPWVTALVMSPLLLAVAACGSHDSTGAASAPRPTSSSTPTAGPTPRAPHYRAVKVDPHTLHATRAAARSYLAGSVRLLASPGGKPGRHPAISGSALQSLLVMRSDYASKHYRVVGSPRILTQQVIKHHAHPQRLVVAACLDNSAVKVLDKHGKPVATSPGPERVMNLLTLTLRDGRWVVTGTALPTDPTC